MVGAFKPGGGAAPPSRDEDDAPRWVPRAAVVDVVQASKEQARAAQVEVVAAGLSRLLPGVFDEQTLRAGLASPYSRIGWEWLDRKPWAGFLLAAAGALAKRRAPVKANTQTQGKVQNDGK